jgi:ABC-type glycerol-3-phosphate transport system substrate-binding protein
MKKFLILVILAGLMASLVAGCGPAPTPTPLPPPPTPTKPPAPAAPTATPVPPTPMPSLFGKEDVKLTFWHTQPDGSANQKALQEMANTFNATNGKRITVTLEYQGNYTQLYQKMLAAIQAGSYPELVVAYESQVADYMKANAVAALDEYVNQLPKDSFDDILPGYIATNKYPAYGNKMLSWPFTKSVLGLWYNEDLVTKAGLRLPSTANPYTWDEFEQAVNKCAQKGPDGKVTVWGLELNPSAASTMDGMIYSRGGKLLTDDNSKVRFNEQPGLDMMSMVDRLIKTGNTFLGKGTDWQNDFAAGKLCFYFDSSTSRPYLRDIITDKGKKPETFKWGQVIIPQSDPKKPVTVMYGANIAIMKSTPLKQAAAWEFVKWFTDTAQSVKWSIASSYMPIRKSAAQNADLKAYWDKDPIAKQSFDIVAYSVPEPNIPGWQDTRTILEDAWQKVISGMATPQAAMDEAAAKANKVIAEAK